MNDTVIDYSAAFPTAIAAQGKGRHVLILCHLDCPRRRFDGKHAPYELAYRELSQPCQRENDEAWACVRWSEVTLWQKKEISNALKDWRHGSLNLFDHFRLFP